jgi:hypothetical protein
MMHDVFEGPESDIPHRLPVDIHAQPGRVEVLEMQLFNANVEVSKLRTALSIADDIITRFHDQVAQLQRELRND